jgi:hypothetical protein
VHIFAESPRGTGDGHRGNWDGSPYRAGIGTVTNGAVGQAVSSVDGPVITVRYKDGEKKIIVGPTVPIVRYEVGDKSGSSRAPPSTLRPRLRSRMELFLPLVSTSAATGSCRNRTGLLPPPPPSVPAAGPGVASAHAGRPQAAGVASASRSAISLRYC